MWLSIILEDKQMLAKTFAKQGVDRDYGYWAYCVTFVVTSVLFCSFASVAGNMCSHTTRLYAVCFSSLKKIYIFLLSIKKSVPFKNNNNKLIKKGSAKNIYWHMTMNECK